MKKLFSISLLVALAFALTSCSPVANTPVPTPDVTKQQYVFKGSNANWTGDFVIDATVSADNSSGTPVKTQQNEYTLTTTYKNNVKKFSKIKKMSVDFVADFNSGKFNRTFSKGNPPTDKAFVFKAGSKQNLVIKPKETIKIVIKIDGKKETFKLHNKTTAK